MTTRYISKYSLFAILLNLFYFSTQVSASPKEFNIIMFGKTGAGKSQLINALHFLVKGENPIEISEELGPIPEPITIQRNRAHQADTAVARNYRIENQSKNLVLNVVDMRGLADTEGRPDEESIDQIFEITKSMPIHLVLFCIPAGTSRDAYFETLSDKLKENFFPNGLERSPKHLLVAVTKAEGEPGAPNVEQLFKTHNWPELKLLLFGNGPLNFNYKALREDEGYREHLIAKECVTQEEMDELDEFIDSQKELWEDVLFSFEELEEHLNNLGTDETLNGEESINTIRERYNLLLSLFDRFVRASVELNNLRQKVNGVRLDLRDCQNNFCDTLGSSCISGTVKDEKPRTCVIYKRGKYSYVCRSNATLADIRPLAIEDAQELYKRAGSGEGENFRSALPESCIERKILKKYKKEGNAALVTASYILFGIGIGTITASAQESKDMIDVKHLLFCPHCLGTMLNHQQVNVPTKIEKEITVNVPSVPQQSQDRHWNLRNNRECLINQSKDLMKKIKEKKSELTAIQEEVRSLLEEIKQSHYVSPMALKAFVNLPVAAELAHSELMDELDNMFRVFNLGQYAQEEGFEFNYQ